MRSRLVEVVLSVSVIVAVHPAYAQNQGSGRSTQGVAACRSSSSNNSPTDSEVSIRDVTFSGFIQMPVSDQDEIAASIKQKTRGPNADDVLEEALERVRAGWQDRGYFKVKVSGEERPAPKGASGPQIVLFVHIEENAQYRLGGIAFKNNRSLTNSERLREVFLMKDGDAFSREKIATGLNDLRRVYGEYGYANYTGVPATTFDEEKKLGYLTIDIDEGKQFFVSDIRFVGLDAAGQKRAARELALKPGDVYNTRLWERSLPRIESLFPSCDCKGAGQLSLDEKRGKVALTLDLSPCVAK
jgi:outer membrane protein assembly factor BamA